MRDTENNMIPNYEIRIEPGPLVSILIPVIRPYNMSRLMKLIKKHAGVNKNVYEVLTAEDKKRIGCPRMIKHMVEKSAGQMVMFIGDDCLPWPNFLRNALKAMATFPDGWGLVGLNDQHHDGEKLATHWLAHKALLPHLGGEFFHTGYVHCWCDQELTRRCKELGRYKWARDAKLKHCNPIINDKYELDDDYRRVYARAIYEADQKLFEKRMVSNWTYSRPPALRVSEGRRAVAIGVPTYKKPEPDFEDCLDELRNYSLSQGIHTVLVTNKGSIVHHSRNKIVDKCRREYPQCGELMMIDDDMTFPPDALVRMLAHDKLVVGTNAYRKVFPFAPICQVWDTKEQRFFTVHIDPAKGQLRRVSTVGTGMILFNMEIFNKMVFPWFEFAYAIEENQDNPNAIEGHVLIGEDTHLCMKAAEAKIPIYCDLSFDIGHIHRDEKGKKHIYTWKDYEESCQKLEQQSEQEPSALLALP